MNRITSIFIFLLVYHSTSAQVIAPDILNKRWPAYWITVPAASTTGYGVYHFRKTFSLPVKPSAFVVHVSADNRYKLYVNGTLVSLGPARGEHFHWYFETVDISSYLQAGNNIIAAVAWNFGEQKPEAQISLRTGFILQGNSETEQLVNTNNSWKCIRDSAYSSLTPDLIYSYYVAGPGEKINYHHYPSNWQQLNYNDEKWDSSIHILHGVPKGVFDYSEGWMLVPRQIPPMEQKDLRLNRVRSYTGVLTLPSEFPNQVKPFVIPAGSRISILLDQDFLTNAYPVFKFSGGMNSVISLSYAEALYTDEGSTKHWKAQNKKGNRNIIRGKRFSGVRDEFTSNGQPGQVFTPLWFRTYRYVKLDIETKNESLTIEDFYGSFTGYPFEKVSIFKSRDQILDTILDVGWRTARLCAIETYVDCPYYEQLQYIGDTRIQALVSIYNTSDHRLVKNAIRQLNNSRIAEGITLSRFPTAHPQEIPPFSLWWIGMLHDYRMYVDDKKFVQEMLPGMRQVLTFFSKYQGADGILKNVPYWNFTDWAEENGWGNGMAPKGTDGSSAVLDLQLLMAYQLAAELEAECGMNAFSSLYLQSAAKLSATIKQKYWDEERQLFSDNSDKKLFSQHANTLAILANVITPEQAKMLMEKILSSTELTQATIYFKYYLHQALQKTGMGDKYLDLLGDWKKQLENGLTTWAEISNVDAARSDCHAWGASPNIEFFRIVLGINSTAPGFSKVVIQPHLGKLKEASGSIPHPRGTINVRYSFNNDGKLKVEVTLPPATPGIFKWKGKEYILKTGTTTFVVL